METILGIIGCLAFLGAVIGVVAEWLGYECRSWVVACLAAVLGISFAIFLHPSAHIQDHDARSLFDRALGRQEQGQGREQDREHAMEW